METAQKWGASLGLATAPNVFRLRDKIVNSYLIADGESDAWAIVDAGMSPAHAKNIIAAAEARFPGRAPAAIILTHAHFDHVGGLMKLLEHWNVPIYAHELELPFLTGRADYPPPDPTVGGGLMARLSPMFSRKGMNLGDRGQALPEDGFVPHLGEWKWIHTPGHTSGHISLFRENDRTLIVGDAFVTVKNESAFAVLMQKEQVSRPPAYFTTDWEQARRSVEALADLEPELAATGHGVPMRGKMLREGLRDLADNFESKMPHDGRYVRHPAIFNSKGVQFIPPPRPDPVPKIVAGVAVLGAVAYIFRNQRRQRLRRRLSP